VVERAEPPALGTRKTGVAPMSKQPSLLSVMYRKGPGNVMTNKASPTNPKQPHNYSQQSPYARREPLLRAASDKEPEELVARVSTFTFRLAGTIHHFANQQPNRNQIRKK